MTPEDKIKAKVMVVLGLKALAKALLNAARACETLAKQVREL